MQLILPSAASIEDELAGLSIHQRIDQCAAVCYQRPPKPTEEEAQFFCKKLLNKGHYPALEFGVVHLVLESSGDAPESKYLLTSYINTDRVLLSGSIRAFMEAKCDSPLRNFLAKEYPLFFSPIGGSVGGIRFAESAEIPLTHRHIAVRFIVNRAISHELVRHRPCAFLQESQRYCRYGNEIAVIVPEWTLANTAAAIAWIGAMSYAERQYSKLLGIGRPPQEARAVLPNSTKTEIIVQATIPQWHHMFNLRCSKAADPEMRRVMIPLRDEFETRGWWLYK